MMNKKYKILLFLIFTVLSESRVFADSIEDVNPMMNIICRVMLFLQGRYGRAIAMLIIMNMSFQLAQGKIEWKNAVITCVGLGLFFAPKTLALFILPDTISIAGYKYTPNAIIMSVCPNIR